MDGEKENLPLSLIFFYNMLICRLLISNAINFLDETVVVSMANVFSPAQLKYLVGKKAILNWNGLGYTIRN